VWFSSSEPVKGKCVRSWICDNTGQPVSGLMTPKVAADRRELNATNLHRMHAFPPQAPSCQVSEIGASESDTLNALNDSQIAFKLELLIKEAKEAFQSVLSRNSDLERELEGVRTSSLQRQGELENRSSGASLVPSTRGTRKVHPQTGVAGLKLPLSRTLREHNAFDISTPQTQTTSNMSPASLALNGLNNKPTLMGPRRDYSF
jgi:hypothetical protein